MSRIVSSESEFTRATSSATTTVVEFTGPNCIICKRLEPMLNTAAARSRDVDVIQADASHLVGLAERYNIRSVPTLILFRDGKALDRKVGFATAAELLRWFESHGASPAQAPGTIQ